MSDTQSPGTKLGLECVNSCTHVEAYNAACWPCIENAIAKALASSNAEIARLMAALKTAKAPVFDEDAHNTRIDKALEGETQ